MRLNFKWPKEKKQKGQFLKLKKNKIIKFKKNDSLFKSYTMQTAQLKIYRIKTSPRKQTMKK